MPAPKQTPIPKEKRIPAEVLFSKPLTTAQRRSLQKLAAKPANEIDYSDAPEIIPSPTDIEVGRFYRPQ